MLNAGYKKEAIAACEKATEKYHQTYEKAIQHITSLHTRKEAAVDLLKRTEDYINSIRNTPAEFKKSVHLITARRIAFEQEVDSLKLESKKIDKVSSGVAGAGVMTGAGVAAFGPTAAMAIATTFGTASTGTAIAALSGAAATNAALAWLGGGALVAGGGGMLAGKALLAMAGPVGWAIGGVALVGGGLMANSKNKKLAKKAEEQTKEIKKETDVLTRLDTKVVAETRAITEINEGIQTILQQMTAVENRDYRLFTEEQKQKLWQLKNSAESLSERIGAKLQ